MSDFVALMKHKRNQGLDILNLDFISLHRGYASSLITTVILSEAKNPALVKNLVDLWLCF